MASPLINLCDPVFKSSISCSTVSSEGYEVTNLLSDDSQKRKVGFLGDRFIKPPIEITLKFPFDVNMRYIKIGAEVGQQKSSGLEIYASSVPYNSLLCSGCSEPKPQAKSSLVCSPTAERIALVFLNEGEKGAVIFCPLQYGRQSPNPVPNINANFVQRSMMWKKRSVIAHTSSLTLRIFKTHGSSVPAVGCIEVWGGPSSCMPALQVADVINLWKSTEKLPASDDVSDVVKEIRSTVTGYKKHEESILVDVTEEFLDAITWEIMALPMVLPSGKVVDQKTLDLHAQAEANWGRHPSDPFTGIIFSDGCRPVLDTALKARIDRFLVLNQDRKDLKTVPRTVGRAQPQICHQSVSRFRNNRVCFDSVSSDRKRSMAGSSMHGITRFPPPVYGQSESVPSCSNHQNFSKLDEVKALGSEAKKLKPDENTTKESHDQIGHQQTPVLVCLDDDEDNKPIDDGKSHEKKLDDSLDFALKTVLSGLPSFLNPPCQKATHPECGSCKVSESLYQLPCAHFLCRPCLIKENKQKTSICQICHKEFKSSDPILHHE